MKTIEEFYVAMDQDELLMNELKSLNTIITEEITVEEIASEMVKIAINNGYSFSAEELLAYALQKNADQQIVLEEENAIESNIDARNLNLASWMANVSSTVSLKDISIPGTHDSATWKMITGEIQCQDYDIARQLNDGIRFLDLRVGYNGNLYHGDFACNVTLEEAIYACAKHLYTNDKETILVQISWEGIKSYGIDEFKSWCASSFDKWSSYWHLSDSIPTIGEVRGKMVLINGDDTGKPGLSLSQFICQNDWDVGKWTQSWRVRAQLKVDLIRKFIDSSYRFNENKMLSNNWNKQFNFGVSVRTYADYINNRLKSQSRYPRGIQIMDFYNLDNVVNVVNSNW